MCKGNKKCNCTPISIPKGEKGDNGLDSSSVIDISRADLLGKIDSNALLTGHLYKIYDRGDQGIILQATSTNTISGSGKRVMNCPISYDPTSFVDSKAVLAVFKNDGTTIYNDGLVIWGGKYWEIVGSSTGANAVSDTTLDAEWTEVDKPIYGVTNLYYNEMVFDVLYDIDNDVIYQQSDVKGNIVNVGFNDYVILGYNPVDLTDWNLSSGGFAFYNNKCAGLFNNKLCDIFDNNTDYRIFENTSTTIYGNTNRGDIKYNVCQTIANNSNIGTIETNDCLSITNNSHGGSIFECIISGDITFNDFFFEGNESIGSILSPVISVKNNRAITNNGIVIGGIYYMNITGLTAIPSFTNAAHLIDVVYLLSSNSTENITSFPSNFSNCYRGVRFEVDPSLNVTFIHGTSSYKPRLEGGANAVIDGSLGEWIQFDYLLGGNKVRQVARGRYS